MKKLVVFDLDGTLAESKSPIDSEMSAGLCSLLGIVKVAVISGGNWPQFKEQVLSRLPSDAGLENLSLLPTCGTKFFQHKGGWEKIYSEDFTGEEKAKIIRSLKKALGLSGFKAGKDWGRPDRRPGESDYILGIGTACAPRRKEEVGPGFRQAEEDQSNP